MFKCPDSTALALLKTSRPPASLAENYLRNGIRPIRGQSLRSQCRGLPAQALRQKARCAIIAESPHQNRLRRRIIRQARNSSEDAGSAKAASFQAFAQSR